MNYHKYSKSLVIPAFIRVLICCKSEKVFIAPVLLMYVRLVFFYLHNIRRIKRYLSRDSLLTLVHAFITSRLDYCNALLYGLPKEQIAKLQRVQNAAARLIMDIGKYSHITPALYELHWLPVLARIQFKILLLAFKAIHGLAPVYISNLLVIKRKSSYNIRSNSGILLEPPRGKMLSTLGERAFQAAAPHLWNELPLKLRTIESVEIFKNSIKTFLFRQFFSIGMNFNLFYIVKLNCNF